eukprot:20601-Pelagococcus_subviridis.AAC.1
MNALPSHIGPSRIRRLNPARVAANLSKSLANAVPFATYSSSVRVAHSSDKPTASTRLAPTLCAWHPPIIVSTGTPIHIASHVVVVPA